MEDSLSSPRAFRVSVDAGLCSTPVRAKKQTSVDVSSRSAAEPTDSSSLPLYLDGTPSKRIHKRLKGLTFCATTEYFLDILWPWRLGVFFVTGPETFGLLGKIRQEITVSTVLALTYTHEIFCFFIMLGK